MAPKLLIDGIVRQTTVFIAQLATVSGTRSPLAHVADQVFHDLAREIEAQGVRRSVVADMFGMALRSYQKKMQRLTESASQRDRSLWEAVLEFVEQENPTRSRVTERFEVDGEREVGAVLQDLVRSGLIYTTGRGNSAVYGVTSEAVRSKVEHDIDSLSNLIWLSVFRGEASTCRGIRKLLHVDQQVADSAIEELLKSGRLWYASEPESREARLDTVLESSGFVIPLGSEQGWEAAVLDHFRIVTTAIANKLRAGATSVKAVYDGGSTFTFTLNEAHPYQDDVLNLLGNIRSDVQQLWERVAAYNDEHSINAGQKVHFYLGQTLEQKDSAET